MNFSHCGPHLVYKSAIYKQCFKNVRIHKIICERLNLDEMSSFSVRKGDGKYFGSGSRDRSNTKNH